LLSAILIRNSRTLLPFSLKTAIRRQMDKHQKENWAKIARHLEKVGATDNDYYIRAKAITEGKKDPIQVIAPLTQLETPD
jgi:hypothetical protein